MWSGQNSGVFLEERKVGRREDDPQEPASTRLHSQSIQHPSTGGSRPSTASITLLCVLR